MQVLCVREDGAVLLRKNDEHAGSLAGLWAGLLGPVEDGETLEDAALRIAWPLSLSCLTRVAHFTFSEEGDPVMASEHEFTARCSGELPEGACWVPRSQLDYSKMPADDAFWYERVLDGELLQGHFTFGPNNVLRCHCVRAVNLLVDDDDPGKPYLRTKSPDGGFNEIRFVD